MLGAAGLRALKARARTIAVVETRVGGWQLGSARVHGCSVRIRRSVGFVGGVR